jgi:hypothetical protein
MDVLYASLSRATLASACDLSALSFAPLLGTVRMNWLRLLEIIDMAWRRSGREPGPRQPDRGWNWLCVCVVCCELRKLAR